MSRYNYFKNVFFLSALMLFLLAPGTADAHPMGNFAICHFSAIRAHRDEIKIHYLIDIAEYRTYHILKENGITAGPDREYPQNELDILGEYMKDELLEGLELQVEGNPVKLEIENSSIELRDGLPGLKTIWIEINLTGKIEYRAWGVREVYFKDGNYPDVGGWKEIRIFGTENTKIANSSKLSPKTSYMLTEYPDSLVSDPPLDLSVTFSFGPGRADVMFGQKETKKEKLTGLAGLRQTFNDWLMRTLAAFDFLRFIEQKNLTTNVVIIALVFAFIVGGGHALQPGHGKTLVAAYLVGTKGKASDALKLGLIVTVTHVAAVIVLFLVLLTFWNKLSPEKVYPWLGVGSGLIILGMGAWIIIRNKLGGYIPHEHDEFGRHINPAHDHDHHSHDHDHPHIHHHHEHMEHSHDHDESHEHHEHPHPHTHEHHEHDHDHTHEIHDHSHDHDHKQNTNQDGVRFVDLLTLGITGGIVPCPTAIMILFASIGLNRMPLGLLCTISFSLGMAAVLIIIGLMVVKAKSFADEKISTSKAIRILPYFSGALVSLIGLSICIKGFQDAGLF